MLYLGYMTKAQPTKTDRKGVLYMANREQIIAGLLVNGTVTATAEQLGMSRAGIYKAMQAESFNEEYSKAKQHLLQEVCNNLVSTLLEAVDVTKSIMNNTDNSPQIRLNASQILFNTCIRLTEQTEVLQRIEKLERGVQIE